MKRQSSADWLKALARPTPSREFLPVIDGWRFVAIMAVILYHLNDYFITKTGRRGEPDALSGLLSHGYLGVPLFFALSGFIIARPFLAGTAPGVLRYFTRRLTRLEPPYLINLGLVFTLLVVVLGESPRDLFPHLLASAAYLHNAVFGGASRINFVAWSLEVEFQFYVLAPALLGLLSLLGPLPRRLALLGLVLLGGWANQAPELTRSALGLTVLRYEGFFAAGILAADIFVRRWGQQPASSAQGDVAVLAAAVLVVLAAQGQRWAVWLLPAAMLLALLGSLRGRWTTRLLSATPIYVIGGMCYTLYLYHFYVISAVGRFVLPWTSASQPIWANLLLMMVAVVPVVLGSGAVLYVLVERPFMRSRTRNKGGSADPGEISHGLPEQNSPTVGDSGLHHHR